jgi:3',5'-cyclic AMP phosphodiesterase CpdA
MKMRKIFPMMFFFFALIFVSCTDLSEVPAEINEAWSYVVFSDVQQGYGVYSKLALNIGNIDPTPLAAFCCGDIMLNAANEAEWLSFNDCSVPIRDKMPLFIARGNHDGNDSISEIVLHQYGQITSENFYYTHAEKKTFFIIIDTYEKGSEGAILGDQLLWLEQQLDSSNTETSIENVFIIMHMPLYPQGRHMGQNLSNADELHQLFLKNKKIRAVFNGHDHLFNKYVKDGIPYITTGGGGGEIYTGYGGDYHHFTKVTFYLDSQRINIKTIDIYNEIIDDFDL